jgi:hypothetical protein
VRADLRQRGRSRAPRVRAGRPIAREAGGPIRRQVRLAERTASTAGRSTASSAPAFVGHGVAAGDGYASRSAVAGRRTSCAPPATAMAHGRGADRSRWAVGRSTRPAGCTSRCRSESASRGTAATERGVWWASRGGEGRPAAARQEPSAAREGRTPDRAESRWPDPPTGSPLRGHDPRSADRLALANSHPSTLRSADRLALRSPRLQSTGGRRCRISKGAMVSAGVKPNTAP